MTAHSPWLVPLRPQSAKTKWLLICAPYAGGSASAFHAWLKWIPETIALYGMELPGHGTRFAEPPLTSMVEVVEPLAAAIASSSTVPYALFGHSLGAVVAYEIACVLAQQHPPRRLFVSGQRAFHCPSPRLPIHDLPDEQLIAEILRYGGTQAKLFEDKELREVFLPLLRSDFTLGETYRYVSRPPLAVKMTAYGGLADAEVSTADVQAWKQYTCSQFNYRMFPGDHFFFQNNLGGFVETLLHDLSDSPARRS